MLDVDKLIAEADLEPFEFRLGGMVHRLPHVQNLTARQALLVERGQVDVALQQLAIEDDGSLDKKTADLLLDAPAHALEAIMKGWLAHAQASSGESQASTS